MKKLLFSLALVAGLGFVANAQTEKSTLLLGGGVGFSSTSISGGGSQSVFTLSPNVGYFFTDNFAAGAQFTLASSSGTTIWSLAPFVRGYFTDNAKGKPFAQVGVGFGGVSGGGGTSTSFLGKAGYALFLNKSVALELAADLQTQTGATVFGVGAGFQIHFGKGK